MDIIKPNTKTKANKDHRCDFCLCKINKGEHYMVGTYVVDSIYKWKTHIDCSDIADTLRMYDEALDGVDSDTFCEIIKETYNQIMIEFYAETYDSKDFKIPEFEHRLKFVIEHYKNKLKH